MKKTFLDFITGCVTPSEARQFQRVLADQSDDFMGKVKKFYDDKENPNVRTGFQNLTRKLFGVEKSPLDLSSQEIDKLTTVIRDRESQISQKIHLKPEFFTEGVLPEDQQMATIVKDFYLRNRTHFNSYKDLSYDPGEKNLQITVRKNIAQKLFDLMGMKPEISKKLMEGRDLPSKTAKLSQVKIPMSDLVPTIESVKPYDLQQFEKNANQFLKRSGSEIKLYNEGTPKDSGITFKGDIEALHDMFLRSQGNSQFYPLDFDHRGQIDTAMQRIRELAGGKPGAK